jgi:hypothetical protein
MKRVYSHSNSFLVFNIRNILENNHIQCEVRNDILNSVAGEAPPTDLWPEVWVVRERDYLQAERVVEEAIHGNPKAMSWFCSNCSETNEPAFELCWKCSNERK